MLHEYTIKNNIVLFQRGPLSNWYGAFRGQENGQFEMETLFPSKDQLLAPITGKEIKCSEMKHIKFNCSEQAMMYEKAMMFDDHEIAIKILDEWHPKKQKEFGREVKGYVEEEWNKRRFDIVYRILLEKFRQNKDLRDFLCKDLNNYIIAEAAPWDKIWGIGLAEDDERSWNVRTWQGQNLLGKALMKVREYYNEYN